MVDPVISTVDPRHSCRVVNVGSAGHQGGGRPIGLCQRRGLATARSVIFFTTFRHLGLISSRYRADSLASKIYELYEPKLF